jgi:hypothetical protein
MQFIKIIMDLGILPSKFFTRQILLYFKKGNFGGKKSTLQKSEFTLQIYFGFPIIITWGFTEMQLKDSKMFSLMHFMIEPGSNLC